MQHRFDIAFACDTDHDRHGIVTPGDGLLLPDHYLAVAIDYLFRNRPHWGAGAAVGKTVVSSSIIARVSERLGRRLIDVPVGFKWFAAGLYDGSLGFGGEESAGAAFLRMDGTVWTTDKDGLIAALLAGEMKAKTGHNLASRTSSWRTNWATRSARESRRRPRRYKSGYWPGYRRISSPASGSQANRSRRC